MFLLCSSNVILFSCFPCFCWQEFYMDTQKVGDDVAPTAAVGKIRHWSLEWIMVVNCWMYYRTITYRRFFSQQNIDRWRKETERKKRSFAKYFVTSLGCCMRIPRSFSFRRNTFHSFVFVLQFQLGSRLRFVALRNILVEPGEYFLRSARLKSSNVVVVVVT